MRALEAHVWSVKGEWLGLALQGCLGEAPRGMAVLLISSTTTRPSMMAEVGGRCSRATGLHMEGASAVSEVA